MPSIATSLPRCSATSGELVAVALRTPPHVLMCTRLPEPAAPELIDVWLARDPEVVGVGAEPATARGIAAAWARRTGGESRLEVSMAMHAASVIEDPPRPVAGRLRLAAPAERGLLVRWWRAFYAEAEPLHPDDAATAVAARHDAGELCVWEDDGEIVSLICARLTGNGYGWIGPVYTPPELRRRGYAGAGVAAASRRLLDAGAHGACCSPTSITRPRTRSTTRSATGGSPTGRTTASRRRGEGAAEVGPDVVEPLRHVRS